VTLACNQRCGFCNADGNAPDSCRGRVHVQAELSRVAAAGVTRVTFTGGEPTTLADLAELVGDARAAGMTWIGLQTNATMLGSRPGLARDLAGRGLRAAFVSLHAPEAALADALTVSPGGHALTVAGVRAAIDAGIAVNLNAVLCAPNAGGVDAHLRWTWREFGRDGGTRVLSVVAPVARAWENRHLIPRLSAVAAGLRAALPAAERLGMRVQIPALCGMPLCLLGGVERFADELHWPGAPPLVPARTYLASCSGCVHRARCSGIWKRYLTLYGPAEFVPVTRSP
jgi:pyruvate-formate lyase-activating enzyme